MSSRLGYFPGAKQLFSISGSNNWNNNWKQCYMTWDSFTAVRLSPNINTSASLPNAIFLFMFPIKKFSRWKILFPGLCSSRHLIRACVWWCWMFGLLLTELVFHNSICNFPNLSFSTVTVAVVSEVAQWKKCQNSWKTVAGGWWSSSEQWSWFRGTR